MRRGLFTGFAIVVPAPVFAHDAFGDLGPFYASLLHPLADPMQASLLIGVGAFLAGRPLTTVRAVMPAFWVASALSYMIFGWYLGLDVPPLLFAAVVVIIGGAATLPARWTPMAAGIVLVAVAGTFVGFAPDRPPLYGALQPILGTLLGIALVILLVWAVLDAAARRISGLAPAVAGSWVAAVGLLAGALDIQSAGEEALVSPLSQNAEIPKGVQQ